jgi:hypothetical protein
LKTKKVSNAFMTMSKYVYPIDLAKELVLGNASVPMKMMVIKMEATTATMDSGDMISARVRIFSGIC